MVVNWSRANALVYGDLTLRIFGVAFGSKLTCKIHLREDVSKAVKSSGVVIRAGTVVLYPRVNVVCGVLF